jgi:hypothetical protein
MSIAGKILAVFNVLAALAAFIYFLPTAWGTRQSWAYAYYRHDLVLDGLPLDKDEKDTEGYLLVDKMSDTTRRQVFQNAGSPVNTQMDEINQVKGNMDEGKALEVLKAMARTGPERDEVFAFEKLTKEGGQAKIDQAQREYLENKFKDPKALVFDEVDKAKDPASKRAAIARVLFNVYDDDKIKRLPVIIGLKEFAREVNQETDAVLAMTARVRRAMHRDLASFEASYPKLIKDIQIIAEKIEDTKKQLEVQELLSKSHNSLVMKRTQDVAEIKKYIFEARQATEKAMKTLTNEQKLLHQAEAEVGKRAKENEDFEKEIRRKEGVGTSKEK